LVSAVLALPVEAKKPAAEDETIVRGMIERVYTPYRQSSDYNPADLDDPPARFEIERTASLRALEKRWEGLMEQVDELYSMNDFSWYCQCQDYDVTTAKLVRQSYNLVGKDRIDANILFSPGSYEGKTTGEPLLFQFRREDGAWKLDDLKFHNFTTLRKGLAADIRDATRDLAKKQPN
jgi:hypothetical protein